MAMKKLYFIEIYPKENESIKIAYIIIKNLLKYLNTKYIIQNCYRK